LHRSNVGPPETLFPPGISVSEIADARSVCRRPTFESADDDGTVADGGDVVPGVVVGVVGRVGVVGVVAPPGALLDSVESSDVTAQPIPKPRPTTSSAAIPITTHFGTNTRPGWGATGGGDEARSAGAGWVASPGSVGMSSSTQPSFVVVAVIVAP
jgi:hypothetical protein